MSGAVIPALVAAGGGTTMLAGIWAYERHRDEAMRSSRVRLAMRFPLGLEPATAISALGALSGLPAPTELLFEIAASEAAIRHAIWVPAAVRSSATATLTSIIPGLRLSETADAPSGRVTYGLRLFIPTPCVLSADDPAEVSHALLAGLAALAGGEEVVIRCAARPDQPRHWRPAEGSDARTTEIDRAWRRKIAGPGFTTCALVLVRAKSVARARELARHVESVIASRRGPVGPVRVTHERGNRSLGAIPKTKHTSGWLATGELCGLLGWPLGPEVPAGVDVGAAREIAVARAVPREGRVLFVGRDPLGRERPVALDLTAARHHLLVSGPSGTGKSVLLARSILSDIAAGQGGLVFDPKHDLVETILQRVAPEHADRIVVLDPGDATRPTPGVAVLDGDGDPDLRAEVLTGALRSIFADVWSVRSDYFVRLGLRTLAEVPGATLSDMGRLFFEAGFRTAAVARLHDPFLAAAWAHYERLTTGGKVEAVQAPMARVMALLNMPRVRAVLSSPRPTLDIARLMAERKWVLASLSPGQLGEGPANFISAALVYLAWSAIESRTALAPERRTPMTLYVDELATLTGAVPFSFELLAERSRGLGAALAISVQSLARIPEPTRSSLLANVASVVSFRTSADDAARLAREMPGVRPQDLVALGRFEVAARVASGEGGAVTVATGRTLPLPNPIRMATEMRDRSAARYGSTAADGASAPNVAPPTSESVGRKRRQP